VIVFTERGRQSLVSRDQCCRDRAFFSRSLFCE